MNKFISLLIIAIITAFASANSAQRINLWRLDTDYMEVSKESVDVPSVKLLDPPTVEFLRKINKVGSVKQSEKEILSALQNALPLDPSNEPFASVGIHYGLQLGDNLWLLIYRDKSNRFEIAKAIEINGLIFQKEDRKYYKPSIFPNVEALIKKSLESLEDGSD